MTSSQQQMLDEPPRVNIVLLAAVAITEGAGRADAEAEARACLARHCTEVPTIDSAVRLVTEMKQWAKGHQ